MTAPTRLDSTTTSIMLSWVEPINDGGCPITSYAVFRNDGTSTSITVEANAPSDTNVRDRPTLRQLLVTNFPVGSTGMTFTFAVQAINEVASSYS
jgi:hypothetical protein